MTYKPETIFIKIDPSTIVNLKQEGWVDGKPNLVNDFYISIQSHNGNRNSRTEDDYNEVTDVIIKALNEHFTPERKTKIVKNLMTGNDVEIDTDTPLCCDPSSNTFWEM